MTENKTRIQIFDIAKGISIILMTMTRYPFIETYPILMSFQNVAIIFKMPTFIFISGYLLSDRLDFKSFLHNKIDGLIKPLIGFLLSLTLLKITLYIIVSDEASLHGGLEYILDLPRALYHGSFVAVNVSFWFIVALFLGQLALKGFLVIMDLKKPIKYLFLITFLIILLILNTMKINFLWSEYIPIFFTYLFLGYGFKKIRIHYFNATPFFYSNKMVLFPILFLILHFTLKNLNFDIDLNLAGLHYNYHYLLILSISGVFSVIYLCRYIEKIPILNSFLVYCSRASFFILAYHIFIKDVFLILFDLETYQPLLHTFLFLLNIVLCCLIYMFLKKVPFVRILFYPLKTIVFSDLEIKLLKSKYINRFIPKEIALA
ncbi:fucose 4-O-acetylase-like acetyltransferase [Mariniflexile fucanivorans]|uniref:Fucose 4-O-acetylase-like acetyltransferase n=1 Tax=Mariniflexile fucanivorans TaxID=264023 RepID=A0A4R1RLD0_9FLAO|nr:acyltransferase family protein [Mariniflexile fucanivorans]TCL66680.1 fucose 4-O-acetylase-like acetyltransferase [Mariniflexile fucanivorans]